MIAILSPAKNMVPAEAPGLPLSEPAYPQETRRLLAALRELSPWQLESLLKLSPELALRAFDLHQRFDEARPSPALLSFSGLAYRQMEPGTFTREELLFADQSLRILDAFYGLLRPLDGIRPYRLELQCKFRLDGENLYSFWGGRIHRDLFRPGEPVVNLASGEFSRLVTAHLAPSDPFLTCDFLVRRRGKLLCLATAAKMARGRMARFLVQNRLSNPRDLREFSWGGFAFAPALSSQRRYVFLREPD